MGRSQAVLAVAGHEVHVLQTGLFGSKRHQWKRDQIYDVRLGPSKISGRNKPIIELQIVPHPGEGKRLGLLGARDEAELRWLATVLRQTLGLKLSPETGLPPFREREQQPADSTVFVDCGVNSVTLTVPPAGLLRGTGGMFVGALIWCSALAVVNFLFLSGDLPDVDVLAPTGAFSLAFWAIGVGMLLLSIHFGRRQAVLAVVHDRLMVLQTGPFGSKQREWPRDAVADIRSGPTLLLTQGANSDEAPMELQIYPRHGKPVGLLTGRNAGELQWLATMLRRTLRVPDGGVAAP
jgi:hypothetical protein